jgi:dolichol-phosphate mannosyltransferase
MNENITLSVLIPSYHEEENLRLILPRLNNTIQELHITYDIIVIDGLIATDNTEAVCRENKCTYVNREVSDTFGSAVRSALKNANGKYILFLDADGSHSPEFIPEMYAHIKEYDIVIASRYVAGGYTENNILLIFMSRVVNYIYSSVLNLNCKDVSNSFKLYHAELFKDITLNCNNFDIVEEILFRMCRKHKNIKIKEIPFSFKKRMFGNSKRNLFLFMVTYIFTLLRLRFSKIK